MEFKYTYLNILKLLSRIEFDFGGHAQGSPYKYANRCEPSKITKQLLKKLLECTSLLFIFFCSLLAGCSSSSTLQSRVQKAEEIASLNNFQKKLIPAGDFVLTTYQRISDQHNPYVFYIEGDGSITAGGSISFNPTPSKVMLLKLAALDTRPNVVYIARPCQYTPSKLNPKCSEDYWVDKRLAEEVVESVNIAINTINNGKPVSLIGFSGGGGVAILVAARNKNVKDIITIAGNLDIQRFSEYHKVYALKGSLNPIEYAKKVASIPQLHIVGDKDLIIPSSITNAYVAFSSSPYVNSKIFSGITHTKGWDLIWKEVLKSDLTLR